MPKPSQIVAQLQRENQALKAAIGRYVRALQRLRLGDARMEVYGRIVADLEDAEREMLALAGIESVKK